MYEEACMDWRRGIYGKEGTHKRKGDAYVLITKKQEGKQISTIIYFFIL
jgi:hypothetical protein